MKITSLIITLTVATALVALAQEGTMEEVKHGAKKTGQTVKDGLKLRAKKPRKPLKQSEKKPKRLPRLSAERRRKRLKL